MASPRKRRPLKHSSSMSQAKEAELQKAFSLADADGSGRITEEEFFQMYRNQGEMKKATRSIAQQSVIFQGRRETVREGKDELYILTLYLPRLRLVADGDSQQDMSKSSEGGGGE